VSFEQPRQEKLIVGVCTFRRPTMLADCLKSLSLQSIPDDISVSLVIVDNEAQPVRQNDVSEFAEKCPFPVHYVHQPRQGIAIARNSILDKAGELDASWIAMIDDDETAPPDWIAQLMAPEYRDTPVLWGVQLHVKPEQMPFWANRRRSRVKHELEGTEARVAHTNNVRFSSELLDAGLRFDESLGFMGGEDSDFFTRANLHGFAIRRTARAVTYEFAHPERLTLSGQLYRAYWVGVSECRQRVLRGGKRELYRSCLTELPAEFLFGTLLFLTSPVRLFKGLDKFRNQVTKGLRRIAQAAGNVAGLANQIPSPYRRTVGL